MINPKTLDAASPMILDQKPVLKSYLKPLWPYLNIKDLVELNVNAEKELRLEIAGEKTRFIKVENLDLKYWTNLCHVLANGSGLAFDTEKQPRVSVELPGGHRFEAMVGSHSKKTISVSIRIKRNIELDIESFGLTGDEKEKIIGFVRNGANMVISGGTSSGKTTFLNTLVRYIPAETRILTVEDTYELDIPHHDQINYVVSRNESNPAIGYAQIIDHLVRSRPDVIIAGEVSVSNSFPIIRMLNSGHSGFMCTVHANTPELALGSAIPQNIVMAGIQVPNIEKILYELIDVVIQLHRTRNGERVVTDILYPKLKKRVELNVECPIE